MKLCKTTITQQSKFVTPLKGDTFFGQLCWMVVFKYGEERLQKLLKYYQNKPFLIVSDGFAKGYLPKPKLPSVYLNEDVDKKKENRKKIWLTDTDLQNGNFNIAKTNDDISNIDDEAENIHNSLNYKTFRTDKDNFAPYSIINYTFSQKDIYFYIDEELFSKDELNEILALLSEYGYGKDNTIGKGRFSFDELKEVNIEFSSKTVMALSPFSPEGIKAKEIFYEPYTKFGKMGANRAYKNPFKKPIILADSGSVVVFEEQFKKPYIGKAIYDIEDIYNDVIHQGYAITIPIKDIL